MALRPFLPLRWGGILLLTVLLMAAAARVGAQSCPGAVTTITQPANGATVSGVAPFRFEVSTAPNGWSWIHVGWRLYRISGGQPGQVTGYYAPHISGTTYGFDLDVNQFGSGSYRLEATGTLANQTTFTYCAYEASPINFTILVGPSNDATRYKRQVTNGNLCGCVGGCAETRSSTLPRTGDQSFTVPVTSWSYRGWDVGFDLTYHSVGTTDPTMPDGTDFSLLSQKNSKWTHSFAQWVEVVDTVSSGTKAVWYGGGGTRAYTMAANGIWLSEDSETTLQSSPGTIMRDSGVVVPEWFRVTDGDGAVYEFTNIYWNTNTVQDWDIPFYRLTRITDRWGRYLKVLWDLNNTQRLAYVEDGSGQQLGFNYNSDGLLAAVQDPFGRIHTFGYTAVPDESPVPVNRQKLTSVAVKGAGGAENDVGGVATHNWSFAYRNATTPGYGYGDTYTGDLVIQKTEPGSVTTNYFYGAVNVAGGRPLSADWDGRISRIEWADNAHDIPPDSIVRVIQLQGNTLIYPGGVQIAYTYDGHDLAQQRNVATGEEVNYTYDNLHNVTSIRTALESAGNPLARIDYSYGPDGRTITGARSSSLGGQVTEVAYTTYNLPSEVRQKAAAGSGYADIVTRYLYDAKYNLQQLIEGYGTPLQQATTFAYTNSTPTTDDDNDQPTAVTDPTGATWSATFDLNSGLLLYQDTPANLVGPVGPDTAPSRTEFRYKTNQTLKSVTDPLQHVKELGHITNPSPSGDSIRLKTYHGLAASTPPFTTVETDPALRPVSYLDENGVRTNVSYTAGGNLQEVVANSTGANGTRISTLNWYNDFDQLAAIRRPGYDNGVTTPATDIRLYYDRRDITGAPVQPSVNEGRVTRIRHLESGPSEYFGYDLAGNLSWHIRLDGTRIDIVRDEAHRVQQILYPADLNGTPGFTETYLYDEFGRLAQVTDNVGITSYRYDALGRISEFTRSGQAPVTYAYGNDLVLKRSIMQVSSGGLTWEYQSDTKGRLSRVVNPFDQAFHYEYDPDGKPVKLHRYANASSLMPVYLGRTEYSYEGQRDWLRTISHYRNANNVEQLIDRFTYSRTDGANGSDLTGRILTETDQQGTIHRFKYDDLGRLIYESYTGEGSREYFFDAQGNRTRVKITKSGNVNNDYYTYDDLNRLQWVNRNATGQPISQPNKPFHLFSYDAAGRVSQRVRRLAKDEPVQTHNFGWDTQDRLRSVSNGTTQVFSGAYDANGSPSVLSFGSGGWGNSHFLQHDASGNILQDTYMFYSPQVNTGTLGVITPGFAQRYGTDDRFFHEDWLGSTRATTNGQGSITGGFAFDAFGRRAATAPGEDQPSSLMWGGGWGYWSTDSGGGMGLVLMGQRYYDPQVGRFMSPDPIGFSGGLNLYEYVGGDPVQRVDPTGLDWLDDGANLSAGWGDTLTVGGTRWVRRQLGADDVVDPNSGWYRWGEVGGTVNGFALGGAGAARNALVMGGRSGSLLVRLGRGGGRFFRDPRRFSTVSRQYWNRSTAFGPANGRHLHHWWRPRRAPGGEVNAGWNLMVLRGGLNSWMNGSTRLRRGVEAGIRYAVPGSLTAGAVRGAYWGMEREQWRSESRCR